MIKLAMFMPRPSFCFVLFSTNKCFSYDFVCFRNQFSYVGGRAHT